MATRFGTAVNQDNTGRKLTLDFEEPAYAATLAVAPNASKTWIKVGTLTGDMTVNATETNAQTCDEVVFMFLADGSARTVTFGTNFKPSATLVVDASSVASASFVYNGTDFIETGRAKE